MMTGTRSKWCCVAGFEDRRRGSQVKESGWPLKAGKVKIMDSFLEVPKRSADLRAAPRL